MDDASDREESNKDGIEMAHGSIGGGSQEGGLRVDEGEGNGTGAISSKDMDVLGSQEVVTWIKAHVVLPGFSPERHWRDDHDEVDLCRRRWLLVVAIILVRSPHSRKLHEGIPHDVAIHV